MYEIITIALIAAIGATTLVLFWLTLKNMCNTSINPFDWQSFNTNAWRRAKCQQIKH